MKQLTERSIWRSLKDGTSGTYRASIPKESQAWFDEVASKIYTEYFILGKKVVRQYKECLRLAGVPKEDPRFRKEFAILVMALYPENQRLIFDIVNNNHQNFTNEGIVYMFERCRP